MDWVALEDYLLALSALREVLCHVALDVLRIVSSFLDALEDRLPLLVGDLLFLILNFLNGLIDVAVVVTQLGLLVALGAHRDAGDHARALVVRPVEVLLQLQAEFAKLLREMRGVRIIRKVGVLDLGYLSVLLDGRVDHGAQLELHFVILEQDLFVDVEVIGVDLLFPDLLREVPDGVGLVLFLLLLLVHVGLMLLDARVADLLFVVF